METKTDKTKELYTSAVLLNDRLHFSGVVEGNVPVPIDYIAPLGDGLGYTSLELLLLSLSTCLGSAILVFLRRMQKNILKFEIGSKGVRNTDHPTGFKSIEMNIQMISHDTTEADLEKVIALAGDKYCPVWSMLRKDIDISVIYTIDNKQV